MTQTGPGIFYYVSGHGYGHATRSAEVINALKQLLPDLRICIRTSAAEHIFHEMTQGFEFHKDLYDIGVVQSDGITMDLEATIKKYRELTGKLSDLADQEVQEAKKWGVNLVVTDIPPIAMRIAKKLNVPGITVTNFTWDWIYEGWKDLYPGIGDLVQQIRLDYSYADILLRLPFSVPLPAFKNQLEVPIIGRKAVLDRQAVRERLGIHLNAKCVLLSFGGMGLSTGSLAPLAQLEEYQFISVGSYGAPGLNVTQDCMASHEIRYPDLVGAMDVVVSKPGYGIVSECAANGTRMLYTDRGMFREYEVLVKQMDQYIASKFIPRSDFETGNWRSSLKDLLEMPVPCQKPDLSGPEVIAREIIGRMI